jgi:molecular chaperone GrpE
MTDEQRAEQGTVPRHSGNEASPATGSPQSAEGAPVPGADGAAALQARCAELEAKCAELQDQHLRAVAEAENVRRRGQDEVAKAHKYGIESFAEALLPVRDSLELALASDAPSIENMKEGVEATLRLLATVFEKNKLIAIDPAGQKFDPNLHQAISMVPGNAANPPAAPNHVVSVLQKGYLINDRVLRPALVTVAQG